METIIRLQAYRKPQSRMFSGRDYGVEVRRKLRLSEKDVDDCIYIIQIPSDTLAINSSFFGGLFADSVIRLQEDGFKRKYLFQNENGKELKPTLIRDIEEGIYDALNC